jgi:restriction system protein
VAEISRKRVGELQRGVFQILLQLPDGLQSKAVLERLQTVVPPTDFEKTTYPSRPTVRRYERIVRFSTIGPVKAGWLIKNKGLWSVTDEGRAAYQRIKDPEKFAAEVNRLYRQWSEQQPHVPETPDTETPETDATTTLEEAEESSWTEIESHLTGMNPYDFQQLVAGLLRGMGYHVAWVAPPGPDGGVDVIAQSDPLGINGPRIKVQVKRSGRMSVKEIRSFLAVVSDGDVGLFVSAGGFTRDAEDVVRNQEKRRTMLVDLRRFLDLWVEHYDKIPEESRRLLPLKPVWFLTPIS